MIEETDKGVSKVKCPPKEAVIEWILRAQEKIEEESMIIKKSFLVAGIVGSSEEELMRDDSTYREIQQIMSEVFGETHVGYVEPESSLDEDPFVNSSSTSDTDLDEPASKAEEQMNVDS